MWRPLPQVAGLYHTLVGSAASIVPKTFSNEEMGTSHCVRSYQIQATSNHWHCRLQALGAKQAACGCQQHMIIGAMIDSDLPNVTSKSLKLRGT